MKKLFTLSLMVVASLTMFGQVTHTVDLEPAGVGADWDWTVTENSDNPALEFVANPDASGINTSATVGKFIARLDGNPWALFLTSSDGEFTFDATNSTVKMMVYKTVLSDVGFKVEGSGNVEIKVANTKVNEWEELIFDFSSAEGQTFNKLVIIPDFDFTPRSQENVIYFDNIQVPDGVVAAPVPGPETVAPVPTQVQDNVIAVFSDGFDAPVNVNYNPGWGQSTATSVETIEGNEVLKYEGLNYQGTTFEAMNVANMDFLHVDYWTPDGTLLRVSPINTGVGQEAAYDFGTLTQNEWTSVDIPISHFTTTNPSLVFDAIDQFKFDSEGTPGVFSLGTFYIDNVYFWKDGTTDVAKITNGSLSLYPNPATDVLNIAGVEEGTLVEIYSASGSMIKAETLQGGKIAVDELPKGVYVLKINETTSKFIKK